MKFIRPALFHYQITGRRIEGLRLATLGIEITKQFDNESLIAWLEMYLGWVLTQQDDMEVAFTRLTSAKQRYKKLDDTRGICLTIVFIEQAKRKNGELMQVGETLEEALNMAKREGFVEGEFLALYELGKLAREFKQWQKCHKLLSTAYDLVLLDEDRYGDEVFIAILGNLGQVAIRLGNYTEAKQYCFESISRLRGPDQVTSFGMRLYLWLAEAEIGVEEFENAMQHAGHALEIAKSVNSRKYIEYSETLIAEIKSKSNCYC
ncbi:MAG: hypothetical protein JXA33_01250 [Anaerolineae bacterium]|nr:hypothetical protein [Anaerolineae bacterium]